MPATVTASGSNDPIINIYANFPIEQIKKIPVVSMTGIFSLLKILMPQHKQDIESQNIARETSDKVIDVCCLNLQVQ